MPLKTGGVSKACCSAAVRICMRGIAPPERKPARSKRSDTVGEPRILVFIVLIRNSGQERRGEDPLPEREALTSCHISEDRLFLRIYYIKYSCSKKYI